MQTLDKPLTSAPLNSGLLLSQVKDNDDHLPRVSQTKCKRKCSGLGALGVAPLLLESIPLSAQAGKDGSWKWTVWATETSLRGRVTECLDLPSGFPGHPGPTAPLSTGVSLCSGLQLSRPDDQGLLVPPTRARRMQLTVNIKFMCPWHSVAKQTETSEFGVEKGLLQSPARGRGGLCPKKPLALRRVLMTERASQGL